MPRIENSEVVKYMLQKLIDITSRKTTEGHAVSTMYESIKKLENKYDFLRHITIKDARFLEIGETITVMSDINVVKSDNVGEALYDIITSMNNALGKDAGHFYIKELRDNIEADYQSSIEEMGLDLGLMQLENEIKKLEKKLPR